MIYLELLLGFLKVGLFSFGGAYAAIPLIRDIVLEYGWIDDEMLTYMIAVSESTPGPVMVNLATYVGSSQGGFWGSVIATSAEVFPSFIAVLLIVKILDKFIANPIVKELLSSLKPAVVGIILATGINMTYSHLYNSGSFSIVNLIFTAVLAIIFYGSKKVLKNGISPIKLIIISAVLGIVVFGLI